MICGIAPEDDGLPEFLPLPCDDQVHWQSDVTSPIADPSAHAAEPTYVYILDEVRIGLNRDI